MSVVSQLSARQRAMLAEMGVRLWDKGAAPAKSRAAPNAAPSAAGALAPADSAQRARAPSGFTPAAKPKVEARDGARVGARENPAAPPTPPPPELTPRPATEVIAKMDWRQLEEAVTGCRACALYSGRNKTVFGIGSRQANWMIVGEAPGEFEDRAGEPFVGPAGKLLDSMLAAMGLSRLAEADGPNPLGANVAGGPLGEGSGAGSGDGARGAAVVGSVAGSGPGPSGSAQECAPRGVYIANVLKCRPPDNRNPSPEEVSCCEYYLRQQVALVQPRIILAMGRFAVQSLLQTSESIGKLRGTVHNYQGFSVIVTYHPAYLLRSPGEKGKAWQDLCLAMQVEQSMAAN